MKGVIKFGKRVLERIAFRLPFFSTFGWHEKYEWQTLYEYKKDSKAFSYHRYEEDKKFKTLVKKREIMQIHFKRGDENFFKASVSKLKCHRLPRPGVSMISIN